MNVAIAENISREIMHITLEMISDLDCGILLNPVNGIIEIISKCCALLSSGQLYKCSLKVFQAYHQKKPQTHRTKMAIESSMAFYITHSTTVTTALFRSTMLSVLYTHIAGCHSRSSR